MKHKIEIDTVEAMLFIGALDEISKREKVNLTDRAIAMELKDRIEAIVVSDLRLKENTNEAQED